jgi:hypothetical protein
MSRRVLQEAPASVRALLRTRPDLSDLVEVTRTGNILTSSGTGFLHARLDEYISVMDEAITSGRSPAWEHTVTDLNALIRIEPDPRV